MTAAPIPLHGRWAWDLRGEGRAVRVSTHVEEGLVNVSLWRGDACVGSARLAPVQAAELVRGLSDGLARLAAVAPVAQGRAGDRLHEVELRLARLEARQPGWRRALAAVEEWAARSVLPR
jgi:hypothetical protein